MTGKTGGHRWDRLAPAAVALYAVFLAVAPFEHHDLFCHIKTPQHCTSCASSPLSVDPHAPEALDELRLADAGRAVAVQLLAESAILPVSSSGRSPPALA
jgi:hypothetical protein